MPAPRAISPRRCWARSTRRVSRPPSASFPCAATASRRRSPPPWPSSPPRMPATSPGRCCASMAGCRWADLMLPPKDRLTICFAHVAYQLQERFLARQTGIAGLQLRSAAELEGRIGEADVLLVSGLWRNELLDRAGRLAFIQSISAGTDQYPRALLS